MTRPFASQPEGLEAHTVPGKPWAPRPRVGEQWAPLPSVPQRPEHPPSVAPVEEESVPAGRRAGRPPAGALKRDRRVNVSLNAQEFERWTAAAGERQVAAWVRDVVEARLEAESDPVGVAEELAGIRAATSRMGGNLNQIARALNVEAQGGPAIERAAVAADVRALRAELGGVLDALLALSKRRGR